MGSLNDLLKRCEDEVGYIEKESNSNLDSKTENKGTNNYTKYSRDVNAAGLKGYQGQPWCATYQFWQEIQEFGVDKALKNWHMTKDTYVGYNCFSTYYKFRDAGKISSTPKVGALVIFKSSHMGRVTKISGNTFYTNEGNTSQKTYDRNGGMVANKSYSINDPNIKGFCIIDYEEEKAPTPAPAKRNYLMKGDKGAEVKTMQENLIYVGFSCGKAGCDGDFGKATEDAVKAFQKSNGLTVDGKYGVKSKEKLETLVAKKKKESEKPATPAYTKTQFIKDVQKAIGVTVDGIVGKKTLAAVKNLIVSKSKNNKHAVVKPLQKYLNAQGFACGTADGIFGTKSHNAVVAFQKKYKLSADGIVGKNTWNKLLGM